MRAEFSFVGSSGVGGMADVDSGEDGGGVLVDAIVELGLVEVAEGKLCHVRQVVMGRDTLLEARAVRTDSRAEEQSVDDKRAKEYPVE